MNDRLPSQNRRSRRSHPGHGVWRLASASLLALMVAAGPALPAQLELKASGSAPAAPLTVKDNGIELSLDQAIELALSKNLAILLQRYTRQQAALGIYQALGIYDLLLTGSLAATDTQVPAASSFQSSSQKTQEVKFNLSQVLPSGGTFSLGTDNSRLDQTVTPFVLFNPTYSSALSFNYNQPLLRNAGRLQTERQLILARANSAISRQEFERQVTLTLQQVSDAYWNLVEARAQLGVAQESLTLAKDLHERNKVQVEVGTLAPLELVQSEAQIATNEENIITAQAAVENSADALRQFLNLPNDLWAKEIVPVTDAKTEHVAIDLNQAIQIAAQRRPDLREAEITVERNQSDAAYFRGQKKPQLDLAVGYGFAGTGAAFRETFNQVNHSDFPGWNATLTLGIPIQNRAARAQSVIADLDVEKAKVALDQLRTQVLTEVRTAARGVDTAAKQIDAAQASRNFEEKTLDAEKKKYENGMSTSFEITRVQNDLAAARSREVSAIVQYRRALTEFYRSTGKLLDQQGIAVADEEPNPRRIFGSGKGIESYETTYTPMSSAPLATPAPSSPAPASHPAPASGGGDHGKP